MSLTNFYSNHYSITYDKYFPMLQNACIRYDKSLKQKLSPTTRAVYQHELVEDSSIDCDHGTMLKKDLHLMELTPHLMTATIKTTNFNRNPQVNSLTPRTPKGKPKPKASYNKPRYNGPVYLPKHIFSEEVKKELDKYNKETKPTTHQQ